MIPNARQTEWNVAHPFFLFVWSADELETKQSRKHEAKNETQKSSKMAQAGFFHLKTVQQLGGKRIMLKGWWQGPPAFEREFVPCLLILYATSQADVSSSLSDPFGQTPVLPLSRDLFRGFSEPEVF